MTDRKPVSQELVDKTEYFEDESLDALSKEQRDRLAQVLDAYLEKLDAGESTDIEELIASHPDLADVLRDYLVTIHQFQKAPPLQPLQPLARATDAPNASSDLEDQTEGDQAAGDQTEGRRGGLGRIGDYIIQREIGRGGMGVVYEAAQVSLGRRVALKTLPFTSVLDPKQVARFKNEAQAAAGLNHQNIVPVYGVGSERGIHYYSMQLIEGQSLDDVISQLRESRTDPFSVGMHAEIESNRGQPNQTRSRKADAPTQNADVNPSKPTVANCFTTCKSVESRGFLHSVSEIGRQAAEALHYSHENGVVHRDIKPSNLMLDGNSQLWITDFGLARIADTANITVSGDLIGTARYMSPEQAGGRLHEVDHRSDVFSLGATLYELLTLEPAFDGTTRQQILDAVENASPVSLSRLNPSIPVDLETIILKSLEKRRDDRYSSARDFAEDLNNFLHGRPANAKRPTTLEHAYRWANRHRRIVAASIGVLLVLLLTVSGAAMMLNAEKQRTEQESVRARKSLSETLRVVDNFGARVDERLEHIAGTHRLRLDLLLELEKFYSRFLDQSDGDPVLAFDLATSQFRLAAVQQRLGEYDKARQGYEKALTGFERLRSLEPHDDERIADVALCHNNIGQVAGQLGDYPKAVSEYELAIAAYQQLVHNDSERGRLGLARSSMNLGLLLAKHHDPDATRVLNQTLESLTLLAAESPDDVRFQDQLALCENNLASVVLTSNPTRAKELLRCAVKRYDELTQKRPGSPEHRSDQALAIGNLAAVVAREGERQEALSLFEKVLQIRKRLVEWEPDVLAHAVGLATTYQQRGQLLNEVDRGAAAEEYRSAEQVLRGALQEFGSNPRVHSDLARVLNNLGVLADEMNNPARAIEYAGQAVKSQEKAVKTSSINERESNTILMDAMVKQLSRFQTEAKQ